MDLLDEALKLHDGDAILAVTLFAQRTLNRNKFLELIVTRPAAARQLANHLESRSQFADLADLGSVPTIQYSISIWVSVMQLCHNC